MKAAASPRTAQGTGFIAAVRKILRFQRGSAAPAAPRRARNRTRRRGASPVRRKLTLVQKLDRDGLAPPEIARRTGLSQDIVTMLLTLRAPDSAETSGQGTFFRILQARIAN